MRERERKRLLHEELLVPGVCASAKQGKEEKEIAFVCVLVYVCVRMSVHIFV